jgi:hypothetical protein
MTRVRTTRHSLLASTSSANHPRPRRPSATRATAFISELADLVETRRQRRDDPCEQAAQLQARAAQSSCPCGRILLADIDTFAPTFVPSANRLGAVGERQARQVIALLAVCARCGGSHQSLSLAAPTELRRGITIAPRCCLCCGNQRASSRVAGRQHRRLPRRRAAEIFEDFYLRTVQDFPVGVRIFIEDKLLTTTGYRDSCALDDALSCQDVTLAVLNDLVKRRLLAYEDRHHIRRVELTHDVLIPVIKASRDTAMRAKRRAHASGSKEAE